MSPRIFELDFVNPTPCDPLGKATFGASRSGRSRFGRDNSPHFGSASLCANERGVAIIEYALLCAIIALAVLVSLGQLGVGVGENFNSVDNEVGDAIVFKT
jgi:Flp pilus assembly pilin Flp